MRKRALRFLRRLFEAWQRDNATLLAAAVAFFATFSLGPLLLIIITIGGVFFSEETARRELVEGTARLVNQRTAAAVERLVETATAPDRAGVTIVGGILLLFGASGVFRQLRLALNLVLDVPNPPEGWRASFRSRLIAVVMVIATMCLLLLLVALSTTLGALRQIIPTIPAADIAVWRAVEFVAGTAVVGAVFAAIIKWVPDIRLRWRDVWKGAAVAAVLFSTGRIVLGMYLQRAMVTSIYGAAASLFVTLVVIFFAVLAILLAAELTAILCARDPGFNAEQRRAREAGPGVRGTTDDR
ncbi:MAG TPA: YihY/virulence factor BrkB family protein [Thermoanaerobaculia bacterium]|nr:YihY/virulence factor BrkB family protein [Thermoanaerobaculia bacterium]